MSFLTSMVNYASNTLTAYQESWQKSSHDGWARNCVAKGCPEKVQDIFNKVAEGKSVGYSGNRDAFFEGTQKSDVSVLEVAENNASERRFKAIVFYVGGISDESTKVHNPSMGSFTSTLKIRDIVAPIILMNPCSWLVSNQTLESDFGSHINHSKHENEKPLKQQFKASAPVLEEIVNGMHAQFSVISKESFDERNYIVASVWIESITMKEGEKLALCGNGIGMDDWSKAIPMSFGRCGPDYWEGAIRGKLETTEYKLALVRPDGSFQLETGVNRKLKDITPDLRENYILQLLAPPEFPVETTSAANDWEVIHK